jgi:hypothetical protein
MSVQSVAEEKERLLGLLSENSIKRNRLEKLKKLEEHKERVKLQL